jgi:dihydrofolate reductase
MRRIVYHVATTLDGYIAREDGSIDGFLAEGDHVHDYLQQLESYDTVIMGRRTYEFGYRFGLEPGKRAYPHMEHYVFSKSLEVDEDAEIHVVRGEPWETIDRIRAQAGTDIYLCGGGAFAGALLQRNLIDRLILKLNPVVFGEGIPLFTGEPLTRHFALQGSRTYESGVVLLEYEALPLV